MQAQYEGWVGLAASAPPALHSLVRRAGSCKWTPKAKVKALMDPGVAQVQKLVTSLRKSAKDDRVLLHYCGLGVPRPHPRQTSGSSTRTHTEVRRLRGGLARLRGLPGLCAPDSAACPPPPRSTCLCRCTLSWTGPRGPHDPHL